MEIILVVFRPGSERVTVAVTTDITIIGRAPDCDLRMAILDVSRKHCRLIREERSLEVEDLGSTNGTYVNGARVQESMVGAGDVIQIGPVKCVVQIDGQPPDEELQTEPLPPALPEEEITILEEPPEHPGEENSG